MNMALVGMAPRETAALTIFMGVGMKGWACKPVHMQAGVALPAADMYVLDLPGIGLAKWSVRAEGDLRNLLAGRNALLLAPAHSSWEGKLTSNERQKFAILNKPYNTQALRDALALCAPELGNEPAAPCPIAAPAAPAAARVSSGQGLLQPSVVRPFKPLQPRPALASLPAKPRPAAVRRVADGSTYESLLALRVLFPALNTHVLLRSLLNLMASDTPQELRLSVHHAIVMHPKQGWVVHNVTPEVLERLARDDNAASSMSARTLEGAEVLQRVSRLGVSSGSLDTFLWHMAELSIGAHMPVARGNAELHLRAMPGFTRLADVSNFYVQLAAICVRLPQTLSSLQAAFAQHDPRDIERFMLLSTASGLGQLRSAPEVQPVVRTIQTPAPVSHPARAGFMRSLLSKLF